MAECRWCGETNVEGAHCPSCGRPAVEEPAARLGAELGSHRLDRLVGEGPVGAVYEAVHLQTGRRVRVKVIDSTLLPTEPGLTEAVTQLVLGATGMHPGLPELVEIALEGEHEAFVSTAWVDGESLRERLARGTLEPIEAVRLGVGLLEALEALHLSGLSHRAVSPGNVLIAEGGQPAPVCLLDVGVSLVSARARTGAHYRSPEQARGAEVIGPATDIYGAGVVLYEVLSGRRPFESNDYDVLVSRISVRRPTPLGELRPDLPSGLIAAVDRAMAPNPSDRFSSAGEMIRALRTVGTALEATAAAAVAAAAPPPPPAGAAGPRPAAPAPGPRPVAPPPSPPAPPVAEPEPAGGRAVNKAAAAFFIGLALAAGAAMLWYTFSSQGREQLPRPARAEAPARPAQPEAEKSRGTIRVQLEGLPAGAVITVDGRRLGANPFRAPRDSHIHKILVEAPGHDPFETSLTFAEDRVVQVEMAELDVSEQLGDFRAHKSGPGANVIHRRKGPIKVSAPRSVHLPDTEKAALRDREEVAPR